MVESYIWGRWEFLARDGGKLVIIEKTYYVHIPKNFIRYLEKRYGNVDDLKCDIELRKHPELNEEAVIITFRREKI